MHYYNTDESTQKIRTEPHSAKNNKNAWTHWSVTFQGVIENLNIYGRQDINCDKY